MNGLTAVVEETPLGAIAISYFAGGSVDEIVQETELERSQVVYHVDRLETVVFLLALERSPEEIEGLLSWSREETRSYLRQAERHLGRWRRCVHALEIVRERRIDGTAERLKRHLGGISTSVEDPSVRRLKSLSRLDSWTCG